MPECAKAHLQQSRISKIFWGGSPDDPLSGEAVREEEKQEKGEGEREGKWLEGGEGEDKGQGREGKGKVEEGCALLNLPLHH